MQLYCITYNHDREAHTISKFYVQVLSACLLTPILLVFFTQCANVHKCLLRTLEMLVDFNHSLCMNLSLQKVKYNSCLYILINIDNIHQL